MTKKKVLLLLSGALVVASVGRASVDPKGRRGRDARIR
jgi:hypothetical protein